MSAAERVLDALIVQVRLDREQSHYWIERWEHGQGFEIEAWLSSLLDAGWPLAFTVTDEQVA